MISKLFFTLGFVAVLFSVSACGDDDSEEVTVSLTVEQLQGTWLSISESRLQ